MKAVEAKIEDLAKHGKAPGKLSLSDHVSKLQEKVNAFLGSKHCAFITNATTGFEIGYKYANLEKGDEVIAPAITFVATISYPLSIGAKVVLADVDPKTINMNPADVEKKIKKIKVIIPYT